MRAASHPHQDRPAARRPPEKRASSRLPVAEKSIRAPCRKPPLSPDFQTRFPWTGPLRSDCPTAANGKLARLRCHGGVVNSERNRASMHQALAERFVEALAHPVPVPGGTDGLPPPPAAPGEAESPRIDTRDDSFLDLLAGLEQRPEARDRSGVVAAYHAWIGRNSRASPSLFAAWFNLGVELAGAGDKAGASDAYRTALSLRPDFHPAALNLGVLLESAGQPESALAIWQQALQPEDDTRGPPRAPRAPGRGVPRRAAGRGGGPACRLRGLCPGEAAAPVPPCGLAGDPPRYRPRGPTRSRCKHHRHAVSSPTARSMRSTRPTTSNISIPTTCRGLCRKCTGC